MKWWRTKDRDVTPVDSILKWLQTLARLRAKPSNSILISHVGDRVPSAWAVCRCLARCPRGKLDPQSSSGMLVSPVAAERTEPQCGGWLNRRKLEEGHEVWGWCDLELPERTGPYHVDNALLCESQLLFFFFFKLPSLWGFVCFCFFMEAITNQCNIDFCGGK